MVINNMGGAAGDAAKAYVHQKKGDGHVLYVESNRMFQNKIIGTTQLDFDDFVPLARLITEYLVWVVRADAPLRSAKDILDQVKGRPGVGHVRRRLHAQQRLFQCAAAGDAARRGL